MCFINTKEHINLREIKFGKKHVQYAYYYCISLCNEKLYMPTYKSQKVKK